MLSKTFLCLTLVVLVAGCQLEEPAAPVAKIRVTENNCPGAPCTVVFNDASENVSIYDWNYQWEFGDGTKSTEKNPSHSYVNGGSFKVKFTLSGKYGTSSDTTTVVIKTIPPVSADFTTTQELLGDSVKVSFTNKSVSAIKYDWDFGDGKVSHETNPLHNYVNKDSTYTITLKAYDKASVFKIKSETLEVKRK